MCISWLNNSKAWPIKRSNINEVQLYWAFQTIRTSLYKEMIPKKSDLTWYENNTRVVQKIDKISNLKANKLSVTFSEDANERKLTSWGHHKLNSFDEQSLTWISEAEMSSLK